ncbi:MAG: acylneuraminate cytidylyltransferase family protein [Bdellovibrionaceae bacterium]|nr:acylneuraminate cytidylyltransferase family protein [Pseudobdellovibrionaceae bacterium]
MYKNKTILALITARGQSKGIPRKNIKQLGKHPLIAWTIEAAKKSKYLDDIVLSTDDNEIAAIAEQYGCKVPFIRPNHLALDTSTSMDVILHALEEVNKQYDYLLLLQPTSPFRSYQDINGIIETTIDQNALMSVSVIKQRKPPQYSFMICDNKLKQIIPSTTQLRRQDFPLTYEHNGSLYLSDTSFLKKEKNYLNNKIIPFIMEGLGASVDLDTMDDWLYAEFLIEKNLINIEN